MKPYEVIEHTADIGIRATGRDLKELFAHTAQGMFSLVVPPEAVRETESREVVVSAQGGWEPLLFAWLRELLYLFDARHFLGKRFEIQVLEENRLKAIVWGESLDLRHPVDKELKAVTYCEFSLRQESDGSWQAQVILDI